jgi:hypothetical protein
VVHAHYLKSGRPRLRITKPFYPSLIALVPTVSADIIINLQAAQNLTTCTVFVSKSSCRMCTADIRSHSAKQKLFGLEATRSPVARFDESEDLGAYTNGDRC